MKNEVNCYWPHLLLLLLALAGAGKGETGRLYRQFQDPPREYSISPYWSWNEVVEAPEVRRQLGVMAEQKVYGAYVFGFDGLRTPWMSKEWMEGMRAALEEGRKLGVSVGFITDYGWPQGDYRDVWNLEPPQSHVLRKNPDYVRRRLTYVEREVEGPGEVALDGLSRPMVAVAGRMGAKGAYDEATLREVTASIDGTRLRWRAPEGRWRVMVFCLEDRPMWRGYVDLMNREAVATYIEMVLEEHYKQFKPYFGTVIKSVVSDHEGEYGHRIAWTPGLFDTFAKMKGYRLEKYLPLLAYEGGRMTEKVRCDYFDVVAELYAVNYWKQSSDWLKQRGVLLTGHEWEESLLASAAFQGDFMRCQRQLSIPGIDALYNWADSPRHFKETASVAHFLERPFWCENQILQGQHSYISPQKMRLGTNMAAVWGASRLSPWFDYGKNMVDFPPVWDWRQPFWKYFHHYADYARRVSYMNGQGHHVAPVLVYHPLVTVWANSSVVFNEKKWDFGRTGPRKDPRDPDSPPRYDFYWRTSAEVTEEYYTGLMDKLVESHWDFDVTDDYFLEHARIEDGKIRIGPEEFRALILPPMTTIRRSAMERIAEFHRQGGVVMAAGFLPTISMESGRDDAALRRLVEEVFGAGGAPLLGREPARAVEVLEKRVAKDFRGVGGECGALRYQHRVKDGEHFYLIVNESAARTACAVEFGGGQPAEIWDADGGRRRAVRVEGRAAALEFEPWEAYYVLLGAKSAAAPESQPARTVVLPEEGWRFRASAEFVEVPYARVQSDPDGVGMESGWHTADFDDGAWREQWLSAERFTVTDWQTLGPFKAQPHQGFAAKFGPEEDGAAVDLEKLYTTADGRMLWWRRYHPYQATEESYATDLANEMVRSAVGDVGYAVTFLWSPRGGEVDLDLAADTAKVWVNQQQVMSFHDVPGYRADRAAFARRKRIALKKGWNELLLKLERERRFTFYLRLVGADDVRVSAEKTLPEKQPARGDRWYRVAIPVGSTAVEAPERGEVFVNGVAAARGSKEIALGRLDGSRKNVLAIRVPAGGELAAGLRFRTGEAVVRLGSWMRMGLENYSGGASYARAFEVKPEQVGRRMTVDLGEVGVAAEVWVNGRKAGERVWKPFRFDVTGLVRAGSNELRVVVANSDSNERAVANQRLLLVNIDLDGLHGPVRLMMYR